MVLKVSGNRFLFGFRGPHAASFSCSHIVEPLGASNEAPAALGTAPCIFVESMRIGTRIAESSKCSTIPEQTSVHHGKYSGAHRLLSGHLVDNAILQPQRRYPEPDAVIDDGRNMLGASKDIDDINSLPRLQ